jgi:hypothetical protein
MLFVFRGGKDHNVSMGMTAPASQNTTVIPRIQKPIRPAKTAGLVAHDLIWTRRSRRVVFDPSHGDASRWHAPPSSSFVLGSRVCAGA